MVRDLPGREKKEIADEIQEDPDEKKRYTESETSVVNIKKNNGEKALRDFIESLHGKIGTEEIIILLVMFLVAADGIGWEMVLLALILIAG